MEGLGAVGGLAVAVGADEDEDVSLGGEAGEVALGHVEDSGSECTLGRGLGGFFGEALGGAGLRAEENGEGCERCRGGSANELAAEGQRDADESGVTHAAVIIAADRIADADRRRHRESERQHKRERRDIQRDLVSGHRGGAERTDQQCRGDKQAAFHQDRCSHRQTEP